MYLFIRWMPKKGSRNKMLPLEEEDNEKGERVHDWPISGWVWLGLSLYYSPIPFIRTGAVGPARHLQAAKKNSVDGQTNGRLLLCSWTGLLSRVTNIVVNLPIEKPKETKLGVVSNFLLSLQFLAATDRCCWVILWLAAHMIDRLTITKNRIDRNICTAAGS